MQVQHLHAFVLRDHRFLGGVGFQVPVEVVEQCPLQGEDYGGRILHEVVLHVVGVDCEVAVQDGFEFLDVVALRVLRDERYVLLRVLRFPCFLER